MEKKLFHLLIILFICDSNVYAQKLPNKQESSLWVSKNIKIDGKATEWDNKFQAYNNAIEVFYTITNDANNLYLIVHATDEDIINKIYKTGLRFTISKTGKRNDKDVVGIIYPVFDMGDSFHVNIRSKPKIITGDIKSKLQLDSFVNINNKILVSKARWIKTIGLKEVDSLISIYNQDDIKAASLFDDQMGYTIELSIALKYLQSYGSKLIYNVRLNASNLMESDNTTKTTSINPKDGRTITNINLGKSMDISQIISNGRNINSTTDFWGEYTLAKKP